MSMLPPPLALMLAQLAGPPRYRFNRRLYRKLIHELEREQSIAAPDAEPEVQFTEGPIDGRIGEFDPRTMRITIDQLEILMLCFMQSRPSIPELKNRFDTEMTRVLAHEGGHYHLQKRHGWLPIVEKIAINIVLSLIGAVLVWLGYWSLIRLVVGKLVPIAAETSKPLGVVVGIVGALAVLFLFSRVFRRLLATWQVLAAFVTYRICWTERYARKFEERPANDRRWDDVIKVE